jgi:hypothetical protein
LWAADVGDPGYQDRWTARVLDELDEAPWNGVFVDDVNSTLRHHMAVEDVARLSHGLRLCRGEEQRPRDDRPQDPLRGQACRGERLLRGPSPGNWARSLRYVSGAMTEQFVKWGDGDASLDTYAWDWGAGGWRTHVAMVEEAARQDKILLANSHSSPGDLRGMRYALASLLLAAGPRASFQFSSDYSMPTWFDEYETARALGQPRDARRALSTGVQMRTFENGLVLVNPTTETVRVDLDGPYTCPGWDRPPTSTWRRAADCCYGARRSPRFWEPCPSRSPRGRSTRPSARPG